MDNREGLNDAEILKNVLKDLRYYANVFAGEIGVTPQAIYNVTKGTNKLSSNLIDRIVKRFPEVNYMYLKAGKMPVIKTDHKLIINQSNLLDNDFVNREGDYSLESFIVLKRIDSKLEKLIELLSDQKKADQ